MLFEKEKYQVNDSQETVFETLPLGARLWMFWFKI